MLNDLKADFGQAYVRAVAHAAGFFVQEAHRNLDADGVDLTLFARSPAGTVRSPRLDVQLKSTAQPLRAREMIIDLSRKNYDELRAWGYQTPRILLVVRIPLERGEWLSSGEEGLLLRHCGYWCSLRGEPERLNVRSIRLKIPRSATFDVDQLAGLMAAVQSGDLP